MAPQLTRPQLETSDLNKTSEGKTKMNKAKNEDHSLGMQHRVNRWVCTDVLDESTAFIIRTYGTGIHFPF